MRYAIKIVVLIFFTYSITAAVCIEGHVPVETEYSQAALVLTADVVSSQAVPESKDGYFLGGVNYTVRVAESLKGHSSQNLKIFSENSSGRFDMELGKRYLIFAYKEHARLRIDSCGNSGVLVMSEQTLAKARVLSRRSK